MTTTEQLLREWLNIHNWRNGRADARPHTRSEWDVADDTTAYLAQQSALDELVRENERLGLYDDQKPVAQETTMPTPLIDAVNQLLHQIAIGDFTDSNGHSAKMLKPVHDLMRILAAPAPAQPRQPLSDAALEALWGKTFSTRNPFCPCDLRTFIKTARAVERAITGEKP